MENEIEIWKDIPNYEGYQVSNLGRVKSFKRGKETLLKPSINTHGYFVVYFYKNGKQKTFKIHKLVAIAFHGHVPDGTHKVCVDHIDNNPLNNHVDNLQLISARENCSKDRNGYLSSFIGITWDKITRKWLARIMFNGRCIHLGYFELEIDAANAYQKALKELNEGLDLNILYPKKIKTSQYKGIFWSKHKNKWVAKYKNKYIGHFNTELEAYEAREKYIANLNLNA